MLSSSYAILLALPVLLPYATASAFHRDFPRPAAVLAQEQPLITPSPATWDPTKTFKSRRDVLSDLRSAVQSDLGGILSELGNVPSYVASGVPNFFQDFPTGDKIKSSLGLDDGQVAALPTQVLNIPCIVKSSFF